MVVERWLIDHLGALCVEAALRCVLMFLDKDQDVDSKHAKASATMLSLRVLVAVRF